MWSLASSSRPHTPTSRHTAARALPALGRRGCAIDDRGSPKPRALAARTSVELLLRKELGQQIRNLDVIGVREWKVCVAADPESAARTERHIDQPHDVVR